MAPEAGLGCCQPHPGGAVFLSGQLVEGEVTAVTSALSTEERASG
jgi:hypothetical protein